MDIALIYKRDTEKATGVKSIGTGAMVRAGDEVNYEGALFALQKQTSLSIHPSGKTALSLLGESHYLQFSTKRITLFGGKGESPSAWFQNYYWWLNSIICNRVSFLRICVSLILKERTSLFKYPIPQGHSWNAYTWFLSTKI